MEYRTSLDDLATLLCLRQRKIEKKEDYNRVFLVQRMCEGLL